MISIDKYLNYVEQIYEEQPAYALGHDGSDGKCDCIGMCKGAERRAGGTGSGMAGTNFAARNTILDLHRVTDASELLIGMVVLKGRQPGESGYDLPDKYKYGSDLTDYYHIGTVTSTDPLVITHMTAPTAKKDTKLGNWKYAGWLPEVERYNPEPGPEPPGPEPQDTAVVGNVDPGKRQEVNLRTKLSTAAALVDRVPVGDTVTVLKYDEDWCRIKWGRKTGYMMTKFLIFEEETDETGACYTVTVFGLTKEEADQIHAIWPNSDIELGVG